MPTRTQKHSHVPHARAADPDLYYKIILFALCGYTASGIAMLAGNIPVQTVARNLKLIRSKLTYNENYLTEIFNRFYHADPVTGKYYSQWGMILRGLKPAQNQPLTPEQKEHTEQIVRCLKDCPMGKSPKRFMNDHIKLGLYNSDTFPEVFDPPNHPWPMLMPVLQDIDGYNACMARKRTCRSCRLDRGEKETMLTIFSQSPYTYIDIAFQFAQFQP